MDPNELLKLLDLKAKPPPVDAPAGSAAAPDPPAASNRPTALEVDEWGLRRGRDLVAESERLQKVGTDAFAAADFFTAAFEPQPRLNDGCVDAKRHQFLTQLFDTPEYRSLHTDTQLDDTAAAIAAGHFAEQFAKLKKEEHEREANPSDVGGSDDGLADEMAALRAVGKAVTDARKEVEELRDAAAALGSTGIERPASDRRALQACAERPGAEEDQRTRGAVPACGREQAAPKGHARTGRRGRRRTGRRHRATVAFRVGQARGAGTGTRHPAPHR
jgi:hypothetical protein